MSGTREPISVRIMRLNNIILGRSKAAYKTSKAVADALSREGLLDAFCLLYNECNKELLKKRDKQVQEFVSRYRSVVEELTNLRVSSDDFIVKALIGKGYFGDVHLVAEKTTKDVYAMKKIKKSVVTNFQVKEERDIMARRDSEWITFLQYSFQDLDHIYLVMEYLPGGDLLSLMIRYGAFDEEMAKFYLAELTLAIDAVHKMGYVHRDIKPENILIDRFGHIKLADFGSAAALNKDGQVISFSPVGTPDYIAPELLQTIASFKLSKSKHDVTCDYWSMGIIGYELIYETTPFHDESVHETYSRILGHCDEKNVEMFQFPGDIEVSGSFRSLIRGLVTKPSARLSYNRIVKHAFFGGINWETIRQQVPPIIPTIDGEEDVSNFEDVDRNKGRRNTFSKKASHDLPRSNEFSGKDLPFIGYSFVHEENSEPGYEGDDDTKMTKLNTKIKELQNVVRQQITEIKTLQNKLLKAEQHATKSESLNKILKDAKEEMIRMKERLKEKTLELAASRTEIKTLQSSLKIEEEMRLKSDASISEVLSSTYKKWEKAKLLSDQNYEKQIAEKKTEISNIAERLQGCESELTLKAEECHHLQKKIENYKDLLKTIKDQGSSDKIEMERTKKELIDLYETKIVDLKTKLKMERDSKVKLSSELKEVSNKLDESICSTNSNKQAKIATEKNVDEMKHRLNKEIEVNKNLRSQNALLDKRHSEIGKTCESLKLENDKLKKELQLIECKKNLQVESAFSSPYITAHGSLTDLSVVEEQLRNDLLVARENEETQRKRAEKLEKAVTRLEEMISKLSEQPKSVGDMLEKQNEKLEDKLASAREQAVIERQSARTANLSLWKVEKQVEDLTNEKKQFQRRMELMEEKMKKAQEAKSEVEKLLKDAREDLKHKDLKINELKDDIKNLKLDLSKEHRMWEKAEQERMKEKSEVIECISQVHKLEEKIEDYKQKLAQATQRSDSLFAENKKLMREMNEKRDRITTLTDTVAELQMKFKSKSDNYEMLKVACSITETQLTEIEAMLETEVKQNKANLQRIENCSKSIREKDEKIAKLKQRIDEENSEKLFAKNKVKQLEKDLDMLNEELSNTQKKVISQQEELINKTTNLFEVQEKIELLTSDGSHLQTLTSNQEKEINVLKEENSKILTQLFRSKEEANQLAMDLKDALQTIKELRVELEQVNGTLAEQKNYYIQRDIKAEATLAQHKKLIDYLQLKVEDLSQKKKKSFADKIFGSGTATLKKENISPNVVETSIVYRALQEELKREKSRCEVLRQQLEKAQIHLRASNIEVSPVKNTQEPNKKTVSKKESIISKSSTGMESYQDHRFELSLNCTENNSVVCIACQKAIVAGSSFWRCKECKGTAHRKCRGDVHTSCDCKEVTFTPIQRTESMSTRSLLSENSENIEELLSDYRGDLVLKASISDPPLDINCILEINENVLLIGCHNGVFAYHKNSRSLVPIGGIDSLSCIAVTNTFSKAILVGYKGERLFQCDLRHLQNRSQASTCLKPKLDLTPLDLPFSNSHEKWLLVKISEESDEIPDATAIAATSSRILIMKYDLLAQRFTAMRSLDTAAATSSILFTRHTVIVGADRFFEIDLDTYAAEEFIDISDKTLSFFRDYQPMAAFRISPQEFLLCFLEYGTFVDEYGCRSRPYDISWKFTPTGFIYREPLLYIAHFQIVQVMRIYRSYRNEISQSPDDPNELEPDFMRAYMSLNMPSLPANCGKMNVYALSQNKETNVQELFVLDGAKAFKNNTNVSLETLTSQATCVTAESLSMDSS